MNADKKLQYHMNRSCADLPASTRRQGEAWRFDPRRSASRRKAICVDPRFHPRASASSGFTVVEALVVVSITVLLTTILLVYSRSSEKQVIFFKEQSLMVSSLLRAKAFSIETFQPELQPGLPIPLPGSDRICGWGVNFDKSNAKFILFTNLGPGGGASACTSAADNKLTPGLGEEFETFTLDPAITISCLTVNSSAGQPCNFSGNNSALTIIFIPPEPTVAFSTTGNNIDGEAVIVIKLKDPTQPRTATIRVNKAGQVSVN